MHPHVLACAGPNRTLSIITLLYIYILLLLLLLLVEVAVAVVVAVLLLLLYTVYMGMDVSFSTELYNNKGIAGMHPEVAPPLAYSIDMEYRQFFRRKSSLKMLFSTCMLVDGRVASFHWVGFKEITLDQWKPPSFTRCSWKKHLVFL